MFFLNYFFFNKNYWAAYSNRSCQLGLLSNQFRLITQTSSGIKMNKIELRIYWTFTLQLTFKLRWKLQKTPTNRKYYSNLAQQFGNVTQIQRNKLSNVYFFIFGVYVKSWAPNAKFDTLYGYQFTLSTNLINQNDLVILLTDGAPQFFLEIHSLFTCCLTNECH